MKSKITIDVDYDNQPIIKIEHYHSEDVRDTLVKRFLERFGEESFWARFRYEGPGAYGGTSQTAVLRGLSNEDLIEEAKIMKAQANWIEDRYNETVGKVPPQS